MAGRFCRKRAVGLVLGGRWHARIEPYRPRSSLLYDALYQRFHGLADWEDTLFVRQAKASVAEGRPVWNKCCTMADIEARCRRADALIESIKAKGLVASDEAVRVNIGPEGELIKAGNGRHRIALALVIGQRLPVQVLVRHRDWEARRRALVEGAADATADHPDLVAIGCGAPALSPRARAVR